jgi:Fic family protein
MAKVIRRRWEGQMGSGLSRRDSRGCQYEAYLPDLLVGRTITLDGDVAADVADAEAAIARLNLSATTLVDTEALARLLLRAEAVASSKIEGLEVGPRRLLRAEAARELGETQHDVTAAEVLANVDAMLHAVKSMAEGQEITPALLKEVHFQLLAGTRIEEHGGRLRQVQNWIGGSDYNPCSADFVPCPWEEVEYLVDDLCNFANDDALPTVAQAAIAHAQFETIHPFVDGNGRTGRALIHLILRRRGLATRILPPISLVLATWANDYVAGLTATRYRGAASSKEAHDGLNSWAARFAAACTRAVTDATAFEERAEAVIESWRQRLGPVRAKSATDLLLRALPGAPILTVNGAASLIDRSFTAANEAVERLEAAQILHQVSVGRRNRAFEAREMIDSFADLERQLASPLGDTLTSPPTRTVPPRRPTRRATK